MKEDYIFFVYGVFFLLSVLFSWLVCGLLLRFAKTLGVRNQNPETVVRWNPNVKPSLGGLTFFIIFLLSLGCHAVLFPSSGMLVELTRIGEIGAVILAFLIGLADDAYDTRPILKFLGQFTCALLIYVSGNGISAFSAEWINLTLTFIWVIGLMNSINMLDNMDAITGVTSLGIIICCLIAAWYREDITNFHFLLMIGIAGAISGFLYFNWHPSRMFMGDTGSQFLGCLLAILGIHYFWNNPVTPTVELPLRSVILPALVFILPLSDTTTVTINRLLARKSPFIGGRDHTTHHLSYLGLSDSQVAFLFVFLSLISALLVWVTLKYTERWGSVSYWVDLVYCILVFTVLYGITRMKKTSPK